MPKIGKILQIHADKWINLFLPIYRCSIINGLGLCQLDRRIIFAQLEWPILVPLNGPSESAALPSPDVLKQSLT
jgi:hypothetical protein